MQLILFNHICVKLANVNSVAETCITTMWLMMIPELTENGNPLSFTTIQIRSNLSVLHFALPYIASKRVNLKTSNLAHWLIIACPTLPMKNLHWKGRGQGQVTPCRIFAPHVISPQRLTLETWNFVHGSAMRWVLWWVSVSLSGRGQGHVSNFYIVDLENFATASRRYTGNIHNTSVVVLFMTPMRQWKRLCHVMVECTCFFTHRPTLTLQLHNFDFFGTCRTSSFCTVARQLARFQLTRRIARSLAIAELLVCNCTPIFDEICKR